MADIADYIRSYTHLSASTSTLERLTEEAAQQALDELPDHVTEEVGTPTTVPDAGLEVSGKHIVSVWAGAERAHRIQLQEASNTDVGRAAHLLRNGRAIWWVDGNTLKGEMPAERNASFVAYVLDDPTAADVTSSRFSAAWQRYIAAVAARLLVDEEMATVRSGVLTLSDVSFPTIPAVPSAPSFTYTDASATAPTSTAIGTLPTVPSFTKPTDGSKPTAITIGTLDLSTEIDEVTSLDAPTVGEATAPTYSGPTALSLSYSDFDTYFGEEDPEMTQAARKKLETKIADFRSATEEALGQFQAEIQKFAEEHTLDSLEIRKFQQQVERQVRGFAEEAAAKVQRYSSEGDVEATFQRLGIEAEQARVQTALEEYRATVQKEIEQAQITAREAAQTAEQATQVDLQNKAKQLEADVREYEMKLQRFQGELGQYERAVETTFRKIEASIGRRKESLRMLNFDRNRLQERADRARRALLHGTKATPSINPLSGY